MDINVDEIKKLVENSKEPLLFKNFLNWKILDWTLNDWCEKLGNTELEFRQGKFSKSKNPQWESSTDNISGTFKDFLDFENVDDWLYFDYKYLKEWLESDELKKEIQWNAFGLDNLTYKDSTIWVGNNGAHTPCHIDTYGYNLVAQIYGRKQWLLFPSNENLLPTRIPYEESSIYSKINFFSPNYEQLKDVSTCKSVILNPGDVLFVPQGWWHYVENLEIAISINTWVPLKDDISRQVEEALVQFLMFNISKDADSDNLLTNFVHKNLSDRSAQECYQTLGGAVALYEQFLKSRSNEAVVVNNLDEYMKKYASCVSSIPTLHKDEFKSMILKKNERFKDEQEVEDPNIYAPDSGNLKLKLLEAVSHPDVIYAIKSKLFNK